MLQLLASLLFFIVFIMLFIALALYLGKAAYDFFIKPGRTKKPEQPPPDIGNESTKLHISGGLLEVNRLPVDEQDNEKGQ